MAKEKSEVKDESVKIVSESEIPAELGSKMDEILSGGESQQINEMSEENQKEKGKEVKEKVEETEEKKDQDVDGEKEVSEAAVDEETKEAEKAEKAEESEEIDPRLVSAARRRGWSDEKIISMAETNPDVLQDLASLMEEKISRKEVEVQVEEKAEGAVPKVELGEDALKEMSDTYGEEVVRKVIQPLAESLNTTIEALNDVRDNVSGIQQKSNVQTEVANIHIADELFDAVDSKVLGKTKDLPIGSDGLYDSRNREFQARAEVYKTARMFQQTGMPFKEAVQEALHHFKGKQGDDTLRAKIVEDINVRKTKFTARPTRKHTQKTYATKEAKAEDVMDEVYSKVGIEA